ncbi:hypothetical protein [Halomonas sp. THAF5a]|uniref:hypothetical protein n=1 Tax=Halomonas sp. THAF5a TaxID=2587844 RepID=UPI00126811E1|nr:hypothetical protein [Halomonas sp. THAF5a]
MVLGGLMMAFGWPALADPVLVAGLEYGQGVLRARSGECFAVTPKHVVGVGLGLEIVTTNRVRAPAELVTDLGDDIAVIRVDASGRLPCGMGWPRAESLGSTLQDAVTQGRQGVILRVRETGGIEAFGVRFASLAPRYIEVRPLSPDAEAFKGMSGSQLMLEGQPVGMVLDTEAGLIRAYRQDALNDRIKDFFTIPGIHRLPPSDLPIEPFKGSAVITTRTDVREAPSPWSPAHRSLSVGERIELNGKVVGLPWYRTPEGFVRKADTTTR